MVTSFIAANSERVSLHPAAGVPASTTRRTTRNNRSMSTSTYYKYSTSVLVNGGGLPAIVPVPGVQSMRGTLLVMVDFFSGRKNTLPDLDEKFYHNCYHMVAFLVSIW